MRHLIGRVNDLNTVVDNSLKGTVSIVSEPLRKRKNMVLKNFRKQILRNTLFYLFYFCGLVYTVYLIASNVCTYYNYSSQLIQTQVVNSLDEVSLTPPGAHDMGPMSQLGTFPVL